MESKSDHKESIRDIKLTVETLKFMIKHNFIKKIHAYYSSLEFPIEKNLALIGLTLYSNKAKLLPLKKVKNSNDY